MTFPHFEVEFTRNGEIHDESQIEALIAELPQFTDLFVISHGWNNDMAEAGRLYDNFFGSLSAVLATRIVQGLEQRKFAALRLFWPSKRFADDELIPGGGAASATNENDKALLSLLEEMKRDPLRLGGAEIDPVRASNLTAAQQLVPQLDGNADARREFVFRLRSILDPSAAHVDDGSEEFFTLEPEKIFQGLQEPVQAPLATGQGGATALADAGGAAGLGDLLSGVKAAARRIANFTSYYEMKQRAGTVGRTGLAQLLRRVRDTNGDIRLHLIGHSFGGRLVTAAAHALPAGTKAVTVTLLQAAFSHNGLADKFDGKHNGAFRELLSEKKVSGPIVITHTKNDRAVGIAYPLASRISRDQASALGDKDDPYGGMGRNGAQHTPEAKDLAGDLQDVGGPYEFTMNRVYNLQADAFIRDHGDVAGHQIAYAVLNAVKAV